MAAPRSLTLNDSHTPDASSPNQLPHPDATTQSNRIHFKEPPMRRELGPLPESDEQDSLEQSSIKALDSLLPVDRFLFRGERTSDKGVDGALEVKVEGRYTNCRAQVQLKSTADGPDSINKDGSYSLSIPTSNLNYLLNGTSPLYVLWLARFKELRFAWARAEWDRLSAKNPNWMSQKSFTIRFVTRLTLNALDEIHERILRDALFQRGIHESLARSAPAEHITLRIDARRLESTDPGEQYEFILQSGIATVAAGHGRKVLDTIPLLSPGVTNQPQLRLIAAYAATSIGKYHDAKSHLAVAVQGIAGLTDYDQRFLSYLTAVCDYETGRIARAEYQRIESEWARHFAGVRALGYRLDLLRDELRDIRDSARRAETVRQIHQLVEEIEASPDAHPAEVIQGKLWQLRIDADELQRMSIERVLQPPSGQDAEVILSDADKWAAWEKAAAELRGCATRSGYPQLVAEAICTKIHVYAGVLLIRRMRMAQLRREAEPLYLLADQLANEASTAIEFYRAADNLSDEFDLRLRLADVYCFVGNEEAAMQVANEILPVARAMNYERIVSRAIEHLEGRTVLHLFLQRTAEEPSFDEIALMQTDEDIRVNAAKEVDARGISRDRLPLVEKDHFAARALAKERRDWCRHLQLRQDSSHTHSSDTAFRADPPRACFCTRHEYRSALAHPDYDVVLLAFKQTYCSDCADREPQRDRAEH
jgi:hypothetical protein